ncbi:hypothetical protein Zm00014a_003387 [Zea mays]|uniref:Uncharacterized protein n=1 Tax=Zea mays TaxID=4577 RepID=A0A3L6F352_MAIZE|nr:hypothetical protein Zm00014a_003387 [Zea mays]
MVAVHASWPWTVLAQATVVPREMVRVPAPGFRFCRTDLCSVLAVFSASNLGAVASLSATVVLSAPARVHGRVGQVRQRSITSSTIVAVACARARYPLLDLVVRLCLAGRRSSLSKVSF